MKIREFNCPNCGKKVNTYGLCKDCDELIDRNPRYYYDIEGLDELIVASTYSGLMKKLIIQFKFYEKLSYKDIISEIMTEKLLEKILSKEVLTYVPMYKIRESQRGFNQSKMLAEKIAKNTDMKCEDIFIKTRDTKFQVGLTKKDREKNLKNSFGVLNKVDEIIIVDDVITTGSTLRELTKIAKVNGIKKVTALVAATEVA